MPTGSPTARTVLTGAITGQLRHVLASAGLSASHQAGEALVPVLIGVVIDRAVGRGGVVDLIGWIGVLAVVFAVLSTSFRLSARTGERAVEQAAHQLRLSLTRRILDHRGGAETGRLPGALVATATGDADRVGSVNRALATAIGASTGLLVGGVALLVVSVPLGLLVLVGAPLLLWLAHRLGRPLERRSHAEQERAAYASGVAADLVAGLRVLKGLGAAPAAAQRYRRTSRESLAATVRAAQAQAWYDGTLLIITGLFVAAVGLLGGRLAAQGDLTVGQLVAAVGLALFLLGPLSIFGWVNAEFAQGRASADRIASVLGAPPATPTGDGSPDTPVRGRVDLRDVRHGTLCGVDLHVGAGELVGVVATDPAVADDLLRCLGRDVDPEHGSVELDGVGLHTLDPERLRAAILVAPHDADLFEGTLRDNVDAAASAGTDVRRALAAADVAEVARTLPQGIDTLLTERGRSLSGGQRQRVALARALAAEPPVLVLHDPTTAVDAATEARIAAGLRELRQGRTTLLVTTSPALLAVTDRVVLLDGGVVRAEGSHPDLIRRDAGYRSSALR
ncbi:multidrug ABC transporter ATP-binding protein [Plantactinospora sp. BC1]|uniref:ABC transporter ATP-binding protein n=1 Tax=Plantactinospora sp. BC1 TaxID=2108470 RepID=UPI000D16C281|nr:ABC transporter ATP-binding protein [Plantactinospora sp. BC1]AVT28958.1 multidrug ABC transporter ATP-binding protein [Plantactinospora sp. BC1]